MIKSLYQIIKNDSDNIIIKLSDDKHPIFMAHFPNNPILPGYCQLEIISDILNEDICSINTCKFISHILPNDIVNFRIQKNQNKRKIKIFKDETKVSEFVYEKI